MSRFGLAVIAFVCALGIGVLMVAAEPDPNPLRTSSEQKLKDNNFKDAYDGFKQLATSANSDPNKVGSDLQQAVNCLNRLSRVDEIDALLESAIAAQPKNWRLLQAAANSYLSGPQWGFVVAGEFSRGGQRGGGQYVISLDRDRVKALQLFTQALPHATADGVAATNAGFFSQFAAAVTLGRSHNDAWRLQHLTDISTLPDFHKVQAGFGRGRRAMSANFGGGTRGAPVDENGDPVFYSQPESWEAAKSDGQRWRWLLAQPGKYVPSQQSDMQLLFATFLREQFDVQTMRSGGFPRPVDRDEPANETGPYAVSTLKETETIAQLATGIKRFALPDEYNFIQIFQQIAAAQKGPAGEQALGALAQIFEDRRQYPRAAEYLQDAIQKYGPGPNEFRTLRRQQIVGNWGRFDQVQIQPAGRGATVDFRYRNGKKVQFEAFPIKVEVLLNDVKNYLKGSPAQPDYQKLEISNIGYRLVELNQQQYVGPRVAQWELELDPLPGHRDRTTTITAPLQNAGAYLLTAQMVDGNISRIIVWLTDTAIVQKPMANQTLYFVADAATGAPVDKANLEFFGWQQQFNPQQPPRTLFANFAEATDVNGIAIPSEKQLLPQYQWVAIARTEKGRFAYLGFNNVWYGQNNDPDYNQNRVYCITDRPAYRPKQSVKFKFWIRTTRYDQDGNNFARQAFKVRIVNPKNEVVETKEFTTDEYGGFDGNYSLPEGAPLGQWQIEIVDHATVGGGNQFRVEEYKKPEFEVTIDSPTEPVKLGEKITATIKAKYYFGAPVVSATVKYKVQRSAHDSHWFPAYRWDWLFGNGYWWFANDYDWYPGWNSWGCRRPVPGWWPQRHDPAELVMENEVAIGADGTAKIEIDTLPAKELHGDQDHAYSITAEVVDESRRTIVGSGNVLVARSPFKVFTWLDRGHYKVGDTIQASFKAQTLDQKPITGKGKASLLQITYDAAGKPVEKSVQNWDLDTNDQGAAQLKLDATTAGQYRLSYQVTDRKGDTREGAFLFVITGPGFDGKDYRFNDLEIIAEKAEYKPGDTVKLMINTNHPGGTVLLFVRPANGIYLPPQVLKLNGKSTTVDVAVIQKDMPNFFVEAVTIFDGKAHTELREIVVPPEQRILNVQITPSAPTYQPGGKAEMQIKLTDALGKAFVGTTVVSIYDKSVEYISGGSNVPDIKKFFWEWRRHHQPYTSNNLLMTYLNLLKNGELSMANLGAFGDLNEMGIGGGGGAAQTRGRRMAMPGGGMLNAAAEPMAMAAAEMPARKAGDLDAVPGADRAGGEATGQTIDPGIRKNFADTALWVGSLTTDQNGLATVALSMPESLSAWKVRTWVLGGGTQVGESTAEVTTSKNILVRMQAPRFFVETDEVVLSANVHNDLKSDKSIKVVLELEGNTLALTGPASTDISVASHGEKRVDWRVRVTKSGEAVIRMKALTDEESDAMEMRFPVYVHGMLKTDSYTGVIKSGEASASVTITVPEKRQINESRLEVRYSPTLAGALVDALPFLAGYPIKTTDTTLTRFLPMVITQRILQRMNVDLAAIKEKQTNLNAQEIGDDRERAKQWKRLDRNPVFDNDEVASMVKIGVQDLTAMQLSDGGWGWLSGWGEHSNAHMTAQIVHGLQIAKQNDIALVPRVLENGIEWLKRYQATQITLLKAGDARDAKNPDSLKAPYKSQADNLDALVFLVLVEADQLDGTMRDYLYRDRGKVSVYALGVIGLAMQTIHDEPKLQMVMQNIDQYLVTDAENQTAYLKLPDGNWWWTWYGSDVEANAHYLKLLSRTDPKGSKAAGLVKYLLNNRKHATYWNSTRDTALCVEAMAEFLQASGEDEPDQTIEIWVDDKKQKEVKVDSKNLFSFDNRFVLAGDAVTSGPHKLEIKRQNKGPVYWNAYLTNFTQEDFITKAGLEVKVQRSFYKLVEKPGNAVVAGSRGQAADQKVLKYDRVKLADLTSLTSQDLVEVELEIDSKNDYEYLIFEDMKAAGFEPVNLRSGYTGNGMGAYMELRDERVVFLVQRLARGKHSLSYRLRAEIPGKFSALPAKASAMYAPELRGNSDEFKLSIEDRPAEKPKQTVGVQR